MEWYENKNLRNYKSKTYQKTYVERRTEIHQSYIHYDNSIRKLGSGGKFRSVDKTWVEDTDRFYYDYANDPVEAPKYADGIIKYTTLLNNLGYTITFKPVCSNVLGVIYGNDIVYSDAFGNGIDLILRSTPLGLKKLVRISENVKENKEYKFRFDIEIPDQLSKGLKILNVNKNNKAQYSEVSLNQTTQSLNISDNYLNIGKNPDSGIIIPTPKVWDTPSNQTDINMEDVGINLGWDSVKSTYYLEKVISNIFMSNSVGDVYTDTETAIDMTESGAPMSASNTLDQGWPSLFNGTAPGSKSAVSNYYTLLVTEGRNGFLPGGGYFECKCAYIWWNASGIHNSTINSATITIKTATDLANGTYGDDLSGHGYWTILDSTITNYNYATLLGSDFYSTNKNIISANNYSMNGRVTSENLTFTLNSTGISLLQNVANNSTAEWGCRISDGFYANSTTPTYTGEPVSGSMVTQYNVENLTNGFEPVLTIDYTLNVAGIGAGIGVNTVVTFF